MLLSLMERNGQPQAASGYRLGSEFTFPISCDNINLRFSLLLFFLFDRIAKMTV